jgi:FAD dependent oxidoreductase
MYHDLIIVGCGVAGLRVGIAAAKKGIQCCILEKYAYVGGRVYTYRKGRHQWESGAGRIAASHVKVRKLMDKYGLTYVPISSDSSYLDLNADANPNTFKELCDIYLEPLRSLPKDVLATHTIGDLLDSIFPDAKRFYLRFPYFSEIHTLRADSALDSFSNAMGSTRFGICKGGLSLLTDAMAAEFISLGGSILHECTVEALNRRDHVLSPLFGPVNGPLGKKKIGAQLLCKMGDGSNRIIECGTCVFALHVDAVRTIKGLSHLPVLTKLRMEPLLRVYMTFPVHSGKAWFTDIGKIVTNDKIRYMIPMGKGNVMISYTDGGDARYWMNKLDKKGEKVVCDEIMSRVRALFPGPIPDPLFVKFHPWRSGTSYWLPGAYSVEEESHNALHPMRDYPSVFMCGESFAIHQCWIESALDHADALLGLEAFCKALK